MSRIGTAVLLVAVFANHGMAQPSARVQLAAHGVVSATHTERVAGGGSAREVRLEQTMLAGRAILFSGHLEIISTLSLDRASSDDGVLTLGSWGGGFYDRHHPHAYVSEAVASLLGNAAHNAAPMPVSLSAGRGVVPFGPDPPMDRPPLRSTVNHHWSQIMERWFGAFAIRGNRVGIELALFDASEHAHDAEGGVDHVGHGGCTTCTGTASTTSGSARVTAWLAPGIELRLSGAVLRSAGHHAGGGSENRMLNVTTSFDRTIGVGRVNGLLEFGQARNEETYRTMLGELQLSRARYRAYYRAELTDRAEGARLDRFRSAPEIRENSVGVTRWMVHTIGAGATVRRAGIAFEPIAEFGIGRVRSRGAAPIDVAALYGARTMWSAVIGLRVGMGTHRRMGSYGAMSQREAHSGAHQH